MYRFWESVALSPDGDGGAGSGSAPPPPPPPTPSPSPSPAPIAEAEDEEEEDDLGAGAGGGLGDEDLAKIAQTFQTALQRDNNDAVRFAERLYRENYQLRERRRSLTREVNQLRSRVPEGAQVLAGDDLAAYQAYQALGKPTEVAALLEQQKQQATELATLQRRTILRQVADATGYQYEVLEQLDRPSLAYAVEPTEGGPAVAYVSYQNGEATEKKPLEEYAALHWKAFLPSLKPQGGPKGTFYPAQRQDDKAAKRDVTSDMIDKRYAQGLRRSKQKDKEKAAR